MQGWAISSVNSLPIRPAIHEAQKSNEDPDEEKNASSGCVHNPRYTSNRLGKSSGSRILSNDRLYFIFVSV